MQIYFLFPVECLIISDGCNLDSHRHARMGGGRNLKSDAIIWMEILWRKPLTSSPDSQLTYGISFLFMGLGPVQNNLQMPKTDNTYLHTTGQSCAFSPPMSHRNPPKPFAVFYLLDHVPNWGDLETENKTIQAHPCVHTSVSSVICYPCSCPRQSGLPNVNSKLGLLQCPFEP